LVDTARFLGGEILVDFDAYFDWLRVIGFRGPVIMHGVAEAEAAESTAFARTKLQKARRGSEDAFR
jgi:sugar phosphate isomerase/epimerase